MFMGLKKCENAFVSGAVGAGVPRHHGMVMNISIVHSDKDIFMTKP